MCKTLPLLICFGLMFCYILVDALPEKPDPSNPCIPDPCGPDFDCTILSGATKCKCKKGFIGDPPSCRIDVCEPNPCGEHSKCEDIGGKAGCSCDESQDTPDSKFRCKPECSKNADCASEKACIKYSCIDPCTGLCGDLTCRVDDHAPICN